MSIIIAYKKDGCIYMGADTQSSGGNNIYRDTSPENYKIWVSQNGLLVGCAGSVLMHQQIQSNEIFDFKLNGKLTKKYIVQNIIPKLYAICDEQGLYDDDEKLRMKVTLSIADKDKLFYIIDNFNVIECSKFNIIGSGSRFASHILNNDMGDDVNEGILKALKLAAKFDRSVSGPYIFIDTKDKKFKVVGE